MVADGLGRLIGEVADLVGSVSNGAQLIERARDLRPDIIVADITMPVMSGLDAMRQLRADRLPTRFIFLTIHTEHLPDTADHERCVVGRRADRRQRPDAHSPSARCPSADRGRKADEGDRLRAGDLSADGRRTQGPAPECGRCRQHGRAHQVRYQTRSRVGLIRFQSALESLPRGRETNGRAPTAAPPGISS